MNNHRVATPVDRSRSILVLGAQLPALILPTRVLPIWVCPATVVLAGLAVTALALGLLASPWAAHTPEHQQWAGLGLFGASGLAWAVIGFCQHPMRAAPWREHRLRIARTLPPGSRPLTGAAPDRRHAEPPHPDAPPAWSATLPGHFVR